MWEYHPSTQCKNNFISFANFSLHPFANNGNGVNSNGGDCGCNGDPAPACGRGAVQTHDCAVSICPPNAGGRTSLRMASASLSSALGCLPLRSFLLCPTHR